jgi:hypothetical protein
VVHSADCVVPLPLVILPHTAESPLSRNTVELDIACVVDPTGTSEVHSLLGVVTGTRMCSEEGGDVFFRTGLDAVCGCVVGHITVFDFLAGLGADFLGVVVALWVTPLSMHKISLCIVQTSLSLSFASSVCCRRSQKFSASIVQMSLNTCFSGRCKSMSDTQRLRLIVRDSMSQTECQRLNVEDRMTETECQILNVQNE